MQDQSRMEISPFVKEEDKQTLKRKLAEMSSNENYMFTVPEAPVLRTAERVRRYIQETTDEIQTRMAQENFEREKKKRKMLVDKWDKANIPVKTLPLTQPMDIHLHTENRLQFNPSTEEPNPKVLQYFSNTYFKVFFSRKSNLIPLYPKIQFLNLLFLHVKKELF